MKFPDKRYLVTAVLALSTCGMQPAAASPSFPDRGRAAVVDAAGVIPDEAERALNQRIVAWDRSTGHQLVVATVPSLQGYDIKDFGYQLGRAWALGRKGQDDGVILLLAPTERKVRIEVGYGLEPVLTDAVTRGIITDIVVPKLKAGDPAGGLAAGADRIMSVIDTVPAASIVRPTTAPANGSGLWAWIIAVLTLSGAGGCLWLARFRAKRRRAALAAELERRKAKAAERLRGPELKPRKNDVPYRYVPPTPVYVAPSPAPAQDFWRSAPPPPTYVSPPPSPAPDDDYWRSPSPSPSDSGWGSSSSDWGSSSSDSGFDSGGGSFGGGGSDSSY